MAKVIYNTYGIKEGLTTIMHTSMSTQLVVDNPTNYGKEWCGGG